MSYKDVINSVALVLEQPVKERGLQLYDIEFVKEGPHWYFRIYIDKDGGVLIEDCEFISRVAEKYLDETDPIPQAYTLEVSSPGLDRQLKKEDDYIRYMGHVVEIKLYRPKDKRKRYQGILAGYADGRITITTDDGEIAFERAEVAVCRLAVII